MSQKPIDEKRAVGDSAQIDRLLKIMSQLRDPQSGCPWDVKQNFESIAPYTIEEAHEVADAIARHDMEDLRDELGDLLLQVVFHAQMAAEAGLFDFDDVARSISEKMIRRHPHVFGDASAEDGETVRLNWEAIKAEEKAARAERRKTEDRVVASPSRLDDVPSGLPSLIYAQKIGRKAAKWGFDWPDVEGVWDKVIEEVDELRAELEGWSPYPSGAEPPDAQQHARVSDELGDCLFALVNLARHTGVDAESALRGTNVKFARRFAAMEMAAAEQGVSLEDIDLDALEALWLSAKAIEERR
jgi:ATP diphosphatase